eukprot:CAMPEP_0179216832 /NCGR_PEP_ID=MMETSP0797-20121207/3592_1 /TAXON_ID=47934 /ORGANISM="Dinophysis acuminata, Strain DAEP01" /LENGTH=351 /DNA_ID=CAMNT_0020923023 /DNA_START=38 /DNA_END=1089 /DNA_ORIENTATION=+
MEMPDAVAEEEVDLLTEKDLYKILGVPRGAKADDIKKAYRKLSLRYHPDKNLGDPEAKPKFQRIAEAFSVLSDDQKRLKYDKSGDVDLEDVDIDQVMNMMVSEMMGEGGMVDSMMQEVLPWTDEHDKMRQFMEEKTKPRGKKIACLICDSCVSNKRLMAAHFEQKHKWECEEWAQDTIKSMKASFESFMKQIAGIGDNSGTFVMPDGTVADMSKVKGVPDIRGVMEKRLDKAKEADAVMDMYRRLAGAQAAGEVSGDVEGPSATSGDVEKVPDYTPSVKDIAKVLGVGEDEAEQLRRDKKALLARLRDRIDRINEEEDDEAAMMEQMGGMDLGGLGGDFGGFGGGLDGGLG